MTTPSQALVDPFADTEIQAAIAHLPSFAPRAKYLGMQRGTDIVSGDDIAVGAVASQHGNSAQVRELTVVDAKILNAIKCRGGFSTAKGIREAITGASLFTVRSRLDRLVADGRVRNVPGQGYELMELGRAAK